MLFGDLFNLNLIITQKQLKIIKIFQNIHHRQTKLHCWSKIYSISIICFGVRSFQSCFARKCTEITSASYAHVSQCHQKHKISNWAFKDGSFICIWGNWWCWFQKYSHFCRYIDGLIDITPQLCKSAVPKIKEVVLDIFEVLQYYSLLQMH